MVDFADIDRDGMHDMIFFKDSSIYTFFNKYSANSESEANLCKQAYDSKHLVDNEIFSKFSQVGADKYNIVRQYLFFGTEEVKSLASSTTAFPGRFHIGDIDADGYPDLLITGRVSADRTQTAIFMNSDATP